MRAVLTVVFCFNIAMVLGSCPDPSICNSGQTCCDELVSGMYGCCPVPNATCCSDGLHCCPEGTQCDIQGGKCVEVKGKLIPKIFGKKEEPKWKLNAVAVKEAKKSNVVYSPGGQYYCQDNNTCCRTPSGHYTCCPYPSADCCRDGLHCCPYGSHCDPTSRYCNRGDKIFPSAPKTRAFPVEWI